MAEICLDEEQSDEMPTNNFENMKLISSEDFIPADKLTYCDKKKEQATGLDA